MSLHWRGRLALTSDGHAWGGVYPYKLHQGADCPGPSWSSVGLSQLDRPSLTPHPTADKSSWVNADVDVVTA